MIEYSIRGAAVEIKLGSGIDSGRMFGRLRRDLRGHSGIELTPEFPSDGCRRIYIFCKSPGIAIEIRDDAMRLMQREE